MFRKNNIRDQGAGIDEKSLLAYIEGNLPPEEEHRLEALLEEDPFLNDAVEGLSEVRDPQQLRIIAAQLNAQLHRQLRNRRQLRRRRRPRATAGQSWLWILIILGLAIAAWWLIHTLSQS